MKVKTLGVAVLVVILTASCAYNERGKKETIGTLGGAAAGGLLGAQFGSGTGKLVATGAGVLIGALIGSEVGRSLDEADRIKANEAIRASYDAPIGEKIEWNNPRSGNSGSVVPVRDGTSSSGAYCREYQQTVTVGGKTEQAYGTACRQPDGSWRIVDQ